MFATLRRIKTKPGAAAQVAALIQTEYLPLVQAVDGFISYTLVDLGDDVISSLGIFDNEAGASEANSRAKAWTVTNLSPFVASPLEATEGVVLVSAMAD